jgi:general secretion pathway protein F
MRFRIKAVDAAHSVSITTIDAQSEVDARRQLSERGLQVISIARDLKFNLGGQKKFPVVSFSQELVALLDAGLTLVEAIDTLTEKEANPSIRASLDRIRAKLMEGRTLSHALEELPAAFPPLYVATVRASEKSGAIREAIMRFVSYQLQIDSLRKKVISASIYPAVLCAAGFVVTVFLLGYVVPRFSGIYEDLGSDLPASSRVLMKWGQLLQEHGATVAFIAAVLLVFAARAVTRPSFRAAIANALTRIPVVGQQVFTYQLARFYRTVGMLLRGGTPATTAFRMSRQLLSEALRPSLDRAIRHIGEGKSFTRSLEENDLTTPVASRMLRVGEKGGNMGEMMERISAFYDDELERSVDILTKLIEPVLMLIIGLIIGFIVVLMYFPIFELAGSIQ